MGRSGGRTAVRDRGSSAAEEELVCGIWREVLKLKQVGVKDDFFEIGGHSLLATQVISRLRNTLGVDMPLAALFEAPTVEGLIRKIGEHKASGDAKLDVISF